MPTLSPRVRPDRCPGALRPWSAEDGLLVRLRLVGGRISGAQLSALLDVAERFGDGAVHTTSRTNLQLRALPGGDGFLDPEVLEAIGATGLLPSTTHERVRNIMISPQTGLAGGRADLRPLGVALDAALCAVPELADLSARFLTVLDDGRGDLIDRPSDLALVALSDDLGQIRVGEDWGPTVQLAHAAAALVSLAEIFQARRGENPDAAWHIAELPEPLLAPEPADPRLPVAAAPLPFGEVAGGVHVEVTEGIDRWTLVDHPAVSELVVTPWRGVLLPLGVDQW